MSLRITIPKPIVELIKHKYGIDEAKIRQEIVKLVYDLVTGETKSILWGGITASKPEQKKAYQQQKKSSPNQHSNYSSYADNLSRAVKYVTKIVEEDGCIEEDKLLEISKKFDVDFWDLIREANLIMREDKKYYPL